MKLTHRAFVALCSAGLLASTASAQSNVIPGTDVALGILGGMSQVAHVGSFPNGTTAMAMSTTSCNFGTVEVPWLSTDDAPPGQPMLEDHPLISFLIARESNGRFQQISDYSFLKHGFFALASSQCTPCQGGDPFGGDYLGIGCSDTYGIGNNGDNYWLAPAEEIDPWLGTWEAVGSFFDVNNDGLRSFFGSGVGTLGNRVIVSDADLNVANAEYYYQSYYVVRGEPEANRENNLRTREFNPSWNGNSWNMNVGGTNLNTTVLAQWDGATVTNGADGSKDGRIYVGVKVTGPVDGLYHYEYAVHNRDNAGGVKSFSLPTCDDARFLNVGMSDIDSDAGNNWTFAQSAGQVTFDTSDNPIRWNSIYSFWFDSDAAPEARGVLVGNDGSTFGIPATQAPALLFNVTSVDGCSFGAAPAAYAFDASPQATLGNAGFGVTVTGADALGVVSSFVNLTAGNVDAGAGCTVLPSIGAGLIALPAVVADASGTANVPVPIPNSAVLEGLTLSFQAICLRAGGGPFFSSFDLSDGLTIRVGDDVDGCL